MSEVLLGLALQGVARDSYLLGTKLGRYSGTRFDFSASRVLESVEVSLERMKTDHLDILLCHDIEFIDMRQIVEETLPMMRTLQKQGKVRFIGVSGYPMKAFKYVLDKTDLDVILSYNHYTLQNTQLADLAPYLKQKGVGIMNAAPFAARLLTNATLPVWHKATPKVREAARKAALACEKKGSDIAKLALQFSISNPDMTTCIVGSANPENVKSWAKWAAEPVDEALMKEVREILQPIHNWHHIEGRPENNDEPLVQG
jgi:aryl-alcohol dehydrogenase-like predicted oxidoreductase